MLHALPTACRGSKATSHVPKRQELSTAVASAQRQLRADLQAWQHARRERIAQESAKKASKPDWKPARARPGGFGSAGALLRAVRLPKGTQAVPRPVEVQRCRLAQSKMHSASGSKAQPEPERLHVHSRAPSADVGFLQKCLGGPDALFEHEVEQERQEHTDLSLKDAENLISSTEAASFVVSYSDSECSDASSCSEGLDLEDMFAFDPEVLAELVNKGASHEELTEHLQTSYAEALEHRLCADPEVAALKESASEEVECAASTPRAQAGDVSQLMTPEVTPVSSPRDHAKGSPGERPRLSAVLRRRSSELQCRPSQVNRQSAAMQAVAAYGRRSLAEAQGMSTDDRHLLQAAIQIAMKAAAKRQRRSMDKALEVLEYAADATNEPLEQWQDEKVDAKVELIQQAMGEACRRHRRSIAEAVQRVSAIAEGVVETSLQRVDTGKGASRSVDALAATHVDERIRRVVSEAYARMEESANDDA